MEAALRAAGVQPRTDLEIGSREAIRQAVARSLGLGAVSEAEFIADPRAHRGRAGQHRDLRVLHGRARRQRAHSVVSERHLGQCCDAGR